MDNNKNWWGSDSKTMSALHDSEGSIDPQFQHDQDPHGSNHNFGSAAGGANANSGAAGGGAAAAAAATELVAQARQQLSQNDGKNVQQSSSGATDGTRPSNVARPLSQSKRAAQNRAAQRAFRQRKEVYIKDLETKVKDLEKTKENYEALKQENIQLRDYILALQSRLIEHPGVPTPPAVFRSQRNSAGDDAKETTNTEDNGASGTGAHDAK